MRLAVLAGGAALLASGAAMSAEEVTQETLKEDQEHVQSWNEFAEDLVALNERILAQSDVKKSETLGGYHGMPEFYREVTYRDAATGELLSRVQWERENPDRLHAIEVYVRDGQGRLEVDYAAAFLPRYRNAPVQTLVNVHAYNDGLHAFRQFDASGERIYEYCEGRYRGEPVQIRLFADDLEGFSRRAEKVMASEAYEACFERAPKTAERYLDPL
ncbi:MAG: hypothetical protein GWO02_22750 [Gammaproteobacteria bacterium]|nr:hypothetical protein [Gammaproteobacteria bacterium]